MVGHFKFSSTLAPTQQPQGPSYSTSALDTTTPRAPRPMSIPTRSMLCLITATGVPQKVPALAAAPGSAVKIRAGNNSAAGNLHAIQFAFYREAFASGHGTPLLNDDTVDCPLDNLAALWIQGNAGDGISISIIASKGE